PSRHTLCPYTTLFRSTDQFFGQRADNPLCTAVAGGRHTRMVARPGLYACAVPLWTPLTHRNGRLLRGALQGSPHLGDQLVDVKRSEEHTSELQSPYDL